MISSLIIVLLLLIILMLVARWSVQEILYKLYPEQLATRALKAVDYSGHVVAVDADKETVMLVLEIKKTKLQFVMSSM